MLRDELTAPEGWAWNSGASYNLLQWANFPAEIPMSKEDDPYRDLFRAFFTFLEENGLKAVGYDRANFNFNLAESNGRLYRIVDFASFEIYRAEVWPYGDGESITDTPFICSCGSEEYSHSSIICHNKECDKFFYCLSCRTRRTSGATYDSASGSTHCEYCGQRCDCGRYHGGYLVLCEACAPRYCCNNCNSWTNEETLPVNSIAITARYNNSGLPALFCQYCRNTFCEGCDSFTHTPVTLDTQLCHQCEFIGPDGDKEIYDDDSDLSSEALQLPSIPGRESVRLCGVEIEGGLGEQKEVIYSGNGDRLSGPNSLARALYDAGLSNTHRQEGYHHGEGFARVETDASCDWECVIGPINMADISHVENLNSVVKIIKDHIKSDLLKLDLRCGTHIHVGAEGVSLGQAYNLHLIYTYMEDVLYRLGAANWPIHRTLINDETHSAQRSPKTTGKIKFARTFHGNRYFGLSFNNYFERMFEACNCGAVRYGVFEDCTCNLGKCTFEFRLFNSTANTIKLHAYLALCQALVALAISMPEIKDANTFEELPFVMERFKDMDGVLQSKMIDSWEERLRYIATDLPLTDDEKKSILYCINNSELAKVSDSVKKLYKGDALINMKNNLKKVGQ